MKKILERLTQYNTLTQVEARSVLLAISESKYNAAEIAAFMTVFMMRIITVDELLGFRNALYEQCMVLDFSDYNTIDLCGTGGDGKDTFNISTLAAFVVAGAGYYVVKHGNYGLSSICGSSNVLEHFGYQFTNKGNLLQKQLRDHRICFLHAPLFHPAMKAVAPIRRELGVRTFFNVLGPMLNPSSPNNQLVGVFNLEMARHYNYIYQKGIANYTILHALDGYDEISLTGKTKLINNKGERIVSAHDLGFEPVMSKDIQGGRSIKEASQLFLSVLKGEGSQAQNNVVVANAAQAIQCMNPQLPYANCKEEAERSLRDKCALKRFQQLIES